MQPAITLYSSVLLLGAVHGLFLALALINTTKGNTLAHRLLALLTLTFAIDLGVDFLFHSRYLLLFPKITYVENVLSFLYGPLTYLYVRALTSTQGFRFSKVSWTHFLPFALSVLLLLPFYMQSNSDVIAQIYQDADSDNMGLWIIGAILVIVIPIPQIGIYLTLAVRRLMRHSRTIRDQFSSIERISLAWLRNLLIALGILYLVYIFALFFAGSLGMAEQAESTMNLMIVTVIYAMGYMGIRQPAIFNRDRAVPAADTVVPDTGASASPEVARKKYQKSALDSDMSSALLAELQRHMEDEKPYLDSTLTLTQLAAQLRISPNYLSQVINEQTGSNFFDFVNQQRVAAAQERLREPGNSSILNIAMDAGFNSKSAFYTAFKQHADMTPSQFRKANSTA